MREGVTRADRERIKALARENKELRQATEILRLASAYFAQAGARAPQPVPHDFIDRYRDRLGVEPICKVLQVAPSAYRRRAVRQRNPDLRSARALRDERLIRDIQRVWQANLRVYGVRKVWRQLQREGIEAARCTVERLMRAEGLAGARRGRAVRTTRGDPAAPCPLPPASE